MMFIYERLDVKLLKKGEILYQKDSDHHYAHVVMLGQVNLYDCNISEEYCK